MVPINARVTQMLRIGGQPLTIQGGLRYWADTPDGAGPEGWVSGSSSRFCCQRDLVATVVSRFIILRHRFIPALCITQKEA